METISTFNFNAKSNERLNYFGFNTQERNDFAEVLGKANQEVSNGKDAKSFLKGLNKNELELIRRFRSLADNIDQFDNLTDEGAYNLLTQYGQEKDFNDDAIVDVGKAKTFVFPPVNAPQKVKDAWEKTVEGIPMKERLMAISPFMTQQLEANFKTDAMGKIIGFYQPGEPGYTNPWSQQSGKSWEQHIDGRIQKLQAMRKYYSAEEYKHKMDFLNDFMNNLKTNDLS